MLEPFELPAVRHRPGSGSEPDRDVLRRAVEAAPARTDPADWRSNPAYLYGWTLLASEYYFEAHEVWEAVWRGCRPNSPERILLQALIQIANAALKLRIGRERASRRLLGHAGELLDELSARRGGAQFLMGVDARALGRMVSELRAI